MSIAAALTNVAVGYPAGLTALIQGRAASSRWDFADSSAATNEPYAFHAWAVAGDYAVVLRAYNDSLPSGVSATVTVHVVTQPVHYVAAASTNPLAPYTSWASAATNIQDAVDAATVPGALVLVTNGTYATGGRTQGGGDSETNRVTVRSPLMVRSVNGPQFAVIDGGSTVRCVYLGDGASLLGFTLTNGAGSSGAGVWCESGSTVVSNCLIVGNSAGRYGSGGGAYQGSYYDCTLSGNSAPFGGGAYSATLNHCTLTGNSANFAFDPFGDIFGGTGGGASYCTLINCTVSSNSASYGGGVHGATLNYCTLTGNSAMLDDDWGYGGSGGAAWGSTVNHCTLVGNWVNLSYTNSYPSDPDTYGGGGAAFSTLNDCTLTGNWAYGLGAFGVAGGGGGASDGTLNDCTLTGNWAASGGGVWSATLSNCTLSGNAAYGGQLDLGDSGGGAFSSTLTNCTLTGNRADSGGGASGCTLNNCALSGNVATNQGGGVYQSTLNNCTMARNSAVGGAGLGFGSGGGGAFSSTLINCVVL